MLPIHPSAKKAAIGLLSLCYAAWFILLGIGVARYEELPTRLKSSDLPLHHFDRFFRATGALLVLGLLGIRALTAVLFPGLYPGSQLLAPGLIYSLQLLLRWGLYYLHLSGLIFNPSHWDDGLKQAAPHIMSDHVLLGAAVQAGLASEACLPLLRWHTGSMQPLGHRIALGLHALVAAVLALLVAGESYFTVRYFHPPVENLVAILVGLLLFQAPLVLFNLKALQAASRARLIPGAATKTGPARKTGKRLTEGPDGEL
ncbi:hypothetical protein ACKKBG_A23900 [Auxenochlorella protothecoides x Auxenochlorella symbiontica]